MPPNTEINTLANLYVVAKLCQICWYMRMADQAHMQHLSTFTRVHSKGCEDNPVLFGHLPSCAFPPQAGLNI